MNTRSVPPVLAFSAAATPVTDPSTTADPATAGLPAGAIPTLPPLATAQPTPPPQATGAPGAAGAAKGSHRSAPGGSLSLPNDGPAAGGLANLMQQLEQSPMVQKIEGVVDQLLGGKSIQSLLKDAMDKVNAQA